MFPLLPFAAGALQALGTIAPYALAGLLLAREFGGDKPSASPPVAVQPPFTPQFRGGQCPVRYVATVTVYNPALEITDTRQILSLAGLRSAITVIAPEGEGDCRFRYLTGLLSNPSQLIEETPFIGGQLGLKLRKNGVLLTPQIVSVAVVRVDGLADNCGNLSNPNPPVPPSVGGGALSPLDTSPPELVYDGIPPLTLGGILAALKAIADAIGTVNDAIDGIKKIGDGLGKIADFLAGKEKKVPANREVLAGAWWQLQVDGGFAVAPFSAQGKTFEPFEIQIEIDGFPVTASRRLGVNSPNWAHLEPLGWIFPRAANGGYYPPVALRFLRNSVALPEGCDGFSYSFLENPDCKAQVRVWYSSDPPLEPSG